MERIVTPRYLLPHAGKRDEAGVGFGRGGDFGFRLRLDFRFRFGFCGYFFDFRFDRRGRFGFRLDDDGRRGGDYGFGRCLDYDRRFFLNFRFDRFRDRWNFRFGFRLRLRCDLGLYESHYVLFDDSTARPGSLDIGEVYTGFGCHLAGYRGGEYTPDGSGSARRGDSLFGNSVNRRGWRVRRSERDGRMVFFLGGGFRFGDWRDGFRFGRGGWSDGLLADKRDGLADRHGRALFHEYRLQYAGCVGLELHHRLVGFYLGHRLSQLHVGAFVLQPAHNGAFLHIVAHLGHGEFSSQGTPPL